MAARPWVSAFLLLAAASSGQPAVPPGEGDFEIVERRAETSLFGVDKNNCFPSRELAMERLRSLQEADRPITVREFLGRPVARVTLESFAPSHTLDSAKAAVREWLESVVIDPEHPWGPPELSPGWAESVASSVRGRIHYRMPHDGILRWPDCSRHSGDFELGGSHHFVVSDYQGVYWWHRLPTRTFGG